MTLSFNYIDKILEFLPKDVNKIIYEYYDCRCGVCRGDKVVCVYCKEYFCNNIFCLNKRTPCIICSNSHCSLKENYRELHSDLSCQSCYFKYIS